MSGIISLAPILVLEQVSASDSERRREQKHSRHQSNRENMSLHFPEPEAVFPLRSRERNRPDDRDAKRLPTVDDRIRTHLSPVVKCLVQKSNAQFHVLGSTCRIRHENMRLARWLREVHLRHDLAAWGGAMITANKSKACLNIFGRRSHNSVRPRLERRRQAAEARRVNGAHGG